ncbi:putative signaling protein [Nymphon striatum]|nr:putative signaling protein [Nymphon striatum]
MGKIQLTNEQELSFQKSLKQEKKHSARIISLLGAGLFICLAFINYFALPANEFANVLPTTIASILVLGVFYTLTYRNCFFKHYSLIGMATFLAVGLAISSIVAMAQALRDKYILKNFLLKEQLQINLDVKAEEAKHQKELANKDALTGLPNRRDAILTVISERLRSCIRDEDHLARIGGDEFLIGLLVKKSEADIPEKIRSKIRSTVIEPVTFNQHKLNVGTSIGTASYPEDGNKIEALIKLADD